MREIESIFLKIIFLCKESLKLQYWSLKIGYVSDDVQAINHLNELKIRETTTISSLYQAQLLITLNHENIEFTSLM